MKTIQQALKVANELRGELILRGYEEITVKSSRVLNGFFEVTLTDDEDTLTITPLLIETCILYVKLNQLTYFIWLNPADGKLTVTIR